MVFVLQSSCRFTQRSAVCFCYIAYSVYFYCLWFSKTFFRYGDDCKIVMCLRQPLPLCPLLLAKIHPSYFWLVSRPVTPWPSNPQHLSLLPPSFTKSTWPWYKAFLTKNKFVLLTDDHTTAVEVRTLAFCGHTKNPLTHPKKGPLCESGPNLCDGKGTNFLEVGAIVVIYEIGVRRLEEFSCY
jgi:hypothetical protein